MAEMRRCSEELYETDRWMARMRPCRNRATYRVPSTGGTGLLLCGLHFRRRVEVIAVRKFYAEHPQIGEADFVAAFVDEKKKAWKLSSSVDSQELI